MTKYQEKVGAMTSLLSKKASDLTRSSGSVGSHDSATSGRRELIAHFRPSPLSLSPRSVSSGTHHPSSSKLDITLASPGSHTVRARKDSDGQVFKYSEDFQSEFFDGMPKTGVELDPRNTDFAKSLHQELLKLPRRVENHRSAPSSPTLQRRRGLRSTEDVKYLDNGQTIKSYELGSSDSVQYREMTGSKFFTFPERSSSMEALNPQKRVLSWLNLSESCSIPPPSPVPQHIQQIFDSHWDFKSTAPGVKSAEVPVDQQAAGISAESIRGHTLERKTEPEAVSEMDPSVNPLARPALITPDKSKTSCLSVVIPSDNLSSSTDQMTSHSSVKESQLKWIPVSPSPNPLYPGNVTSSEPQYAILHSPCSSLRSVSTSSESDILEGGRPRRHRKYMTVQLGEVVTSKVIETVEEVIVSVAKPRTADDQVESISESMENAEADKVSSVEAVATEEKLSDSIETRETIKIHDESTKVCVAEDVRENMEEGKGHFASKSQEGHDKNKQNQVLDTDSVVFEDVRMFYQRENRHISDIVSSGNVVDERTKAGDKFDSEELMKLSTDVIKAHGSNLQEDKKASIEQVVVGERGRLPSTERHEELLILDGNSPTVMVHAQALLKSESVSFSTGEDFNKPNANNTKTLCKSMHNTGSGALSKELSNGTRHISESGRGEDTAQQSGDQLEYDSLNESIKDTKGETESETGKSECLYNEDDKDVLNMADTDKGTSGILEFKKTVTDKNHEHSNNGAVDHTDPDIGESGETGATDRSVADVDLKSIERYEEKIIVMKDVGRQQIKVSSLSRLNIIEEVLRTEIKDIELSDDVNANREEKDASKNKNVANVQTILSDTQEYLDTLKEELTNKPETGQVICSTNSDDAQKGYDDHRSFQCETAQQSEIGGTESESVTGNESLGGVSVSESEITNAELDTVKEELTAERSGKDQELSTENNTVELVIDETLHGITEVLEDETLEVKDISYLDVEITLPDVPDGDLVDQNLEMPDSDGVEDGTFMIKEVSPETEEPIEAIFRDGSKSQESRDIMISVPKTMSEFIMGGNGTDTCAGVLEDGEIVLLQVNASDDISDLVGGTSKLRITDATVPPDGFNAEDSGEAVSQNIPISEDNGSGVMESRNNEVVVVTPNTVDDNYMLKTVEISEENVGECDIGAAGSGNSQESGYIVGPDSEILDKDDTTDTFVTLSEDGEISLLYADRTSHNINEATSKLSTSKGTTKPVYGLKAQDPSECVEIAVNNVSLNVPDEGDTGSSVLNVEGKPVVVAKPDIVYDKHTQIDDEESESEYALCNIGVIEMAKDGDKAGYQAVNDDAETVRNVTEIRGVSDRDVAAYNINELEIVEERNGKFVDEMALSDYTGTVNKRVDVRGQSDVAETSSVRGVIPVDGRCLQDTEALVQEAATEPSVVMEPAGEHIENLCEGRDTVELVDEATTDPSTVAKESISEYSETVYCAREVHESVVELRSSIPDREQLEQSDYLVHDMKIGAIDPVDKLDTSPLPSSTEKQGASNPKECMSEKREILQESERAEVEFSHTEAGSDTSKGNELGAGLPEDGTPFDEGGLNVTHGYHPETMSDITKAMESQSDGAGMIQDTDEQLEPHPDTAHTTGSFSTTDSVQPVSVETKSMVSQTEDGEKSQDTKEQPHSDISKNTGSVGAVDSGLSSAEEVIDFASVKHAAWVTAEYVAVWGLFTCCFHRQFS